MIAKKMIKIFPDGGPIVVKAFYLFLLFAETAFNRINNVKVVSVLNELASFLNLISPVGCDTST